jgi:hypothetical protein
VDALQSLVHGALPHLSETLWAGNPPKTDPETQNHEVRARGGRRMKEKSIDVAIMHCTQCDKRILVSAEDWAAEWHKKPVCPKCQKKNPQSVEPVPNEDREEMEQVPEELENPSGDEDQQTLGSAPVGSFSAPTLTPITIRQGKQLTLF